MASVMPNADINELITKAGKFDFFSDRISFGCGQLTNLVGCSINERVALDFVRGIKVDHEFYQRVLFIIRLDNQQEFLPYTLLDYLSLKEKEHEVVLNTISHEGTRYSSEFVIQKYLKTKNQADSKQAPEPLHIFYLQQFIVA